MSARELLTDIHALEEELLSFERKYGLRSDVFHAAYAQGEEPEKLCWYGCQPHPDDSTLRFSHPHHKHVQPDIKRHRLPAPQMSFVRPNLPELIAEVERLLPPA